MAQNTIVLLSAPSVNEKYYSEKFYDIISYIKDFTNAVNTGDSDRAFVLCDRPTRKILKNILPENTLIQANIYDIWIRDFAPVSTSVIVKFDYKPEYIDNITADEIDNSYRNWFNSSGLTYNSDSQLILDGGNFVWNGAYKAILTKRVFTDNPDYSEEQTDLMLKELLNLKEICYLPEEEGDLTGHSDGMVMFIDTNHVLINDYSEDTNFQISVMEAIETAFPGIKITKIPYPIDLTYWHEWPSACGAYLNSLVTKDNIYVPMYGLPEDNIVLDIISNITTKNIIQVDARKICCMGGSVRCMTWTVSGNNIDNLLNSFDLEDEHTDFFISPNPITNQINVSIINHESGYYNVKLTDTKGKLVKEYGKFTSDNLSLSTDGITSGVYILYIDDERHIKSYGKEILIIK